VRQEVGFLSVVVSFKAVAGSSVARMLVVLGLPAVLGACGFGLPASAPTRLELAVSGTESGVNYSVIKIDARTVSVLQRFHPTFGPELRTARYAPTNALRVGDAVAITVYESGGSNLFPPPSVVPGAAAVASSGSVATGASNVPPQTIERDGTIFVPFVGRLRVVGMTPGQMGQLIEQQLTGKAVSPQVLVTLVNSTGTSATVTGEVNSSRAVPLGARGERLLDVIAGAGGAKYPAYETYVQLVRGSRTGRVLLQNIIDDPNENIFVRPGDQVYLIRNPRTFVVMGATFRPALYPFQFEKVSLADALATSGGPTDVTGDPSGIYLFRFEAWELAKELLEPSAIASHGPTPPPYVPIMYRIDMRDADTYFLAQAVQMRDKDVVLVTNSTTTQLAKMVAVVKGFTGLGFDVAQIKRLTD
jgi:polysaccharide export outer membrane protein